MKNNKLKDKRIELLNGIYNYFNNGGFFNPEMMQHDKVRKKRLIGKIVKMRNQIISYGF